MKERSIKKSLRATAQQILLNPVFESLFDRISPVRSLGKRGERIAERLLLKKGMFIVDREYSERFGEIDLVAIDDRTVVFVEVKTRVSDFAGSAAEAVDEQKQKKITQVATAYLTRRSLHDCRCRFDVIAITMDPNQKPVVQHFENAFEACE